jgi:endonuclease III
VWYRAEEEGGGVRAVLRDYLRLDVPLAAQYAAWAAADPVFAAHAAAFRGLRLLRQDPWENVVAFICSSCNHIVRIAQMVAKLCVRYGAVAGQAADGRAYHAFPTLECLAAAGMEEELRALGFGYRARYIHQAAQQILREHGGVAWLHGLRAAPYADARAALLRLPGIGLKVADCICLMSLVRAHTQCPYARKPPPPPPTHTHTRTLARPGQPGSPSGTACGLGTNAYGEPAKGQAGGGAGGHACVADCGAGLWAGPAGQGTHAAHLSVHRRPLSEHVRRPRRLGPLGTPWHRRVVP